MKTIFVAGATGVIGRRLLPLLRDSGAIVYGTTRRADPSERLWVYHRRGEPCRICGTAIQAFKQGLEARTSFWCPKCQPQTTETSMS